MAGCDWSEIPEDILVSVAKRLHSVTDYLCATQVCKTWRSITLSPCNHIPIPKPPFLLLAESDPKKKSMESEAEQHQVEDSEWEKEPTWVSEEEEEEEEKKEEEEEDVDDEELTGRGIVGLNSGGGDRICELHLPELHGNRCLGSTGNWLIIVNKEQQVNIFNPFTRAQFQLPPQSTLPFPYGLSAQQDLRDRFLSKVVLSSTPNFPYSDLGGVVAVTIYGGVRQLAFAKPGDQSWITVECTIPGERCVDDVIFLRNRLYFVNCSGTVGFYHGFDSPTNPITATEVSGAFRNPAMRYKKHYLVEWLGELLLVRKNILCRPRLPYYKTKEFQVFKFDFDNAEWEELRCLGQHSLFLGFSTSVSLLASPDSSSPFQRNCIYFTDDYMIGYLGNGTEGGRDMGVYNLEDRTLKPHYAGISTSLYSPPLWIIPSCLSQV